MTRMWPMRAAVVMGLVVAAWAVPVRAAEEQARVATGIPGVVEAGAPITLVQGGYQFTEGPLPAADGGLYFVDSMASRMFRLAPGGAITLQREHTEGLNGQALDRRGRRLAAVGGAKKVVALDAAGREVRVVSAGLPGTPLLTPNDVIAHRTGVVYFTDPGPIENSQGKVYWVTATGDTRLLSDRVEWPNGIQLSPDERTLYVDNTKGDGVMAFTIAPDGTPGEGRLFARLQGLKAGGSSGADGMAVDRTGRVYVTSSAGIQVFSPLGTHLGTIALPVPAANLAFGGPGKRTLYVMARQAVYRIPMRAAGPARPGK